MDLNNQNNNNRKIINSLNLGDIIYINECKYLVLTHLREQLFYDAVVADIIHDITFLDLNTDKQITYSFNKHNIHKYVIECIQDEYILK